MSDIPTPHTQRFELIDALRGFALFGVLLVNLESLSLFELVPADGSQMLAMTSVGRGLEAFIGTFFFALDLAS